MTDELKQGVKAEPAGDIEKQISAIIYTHVDFVREVRGTTVTGLDDAARAIIALFQPQMEAAEGLLRADDAALVAIVHNADDANLKTAQLANAACSVRAAGLGGRRD